MNRTFRYPLMPTAAQETVLTQWLVLCQRLYNGALEQRIDAWRKQRRSLTRIGQQRELTELRAQDAEYGDMSVWAARSALRRLELAFQAFFRRLKRGANPGFPRFRSLDRYDSFGVGRVLPRGDRLRIPRLGLVRFKLYRPLQGAVRDVQIRRTARRWYVCFNCDLGAAPPKVAVRAATGIDLGLTDFMTVADGTSVPAPRFFRKGQEQLARRQQALARKKRGSASRRRAKLLVARTYEHVKNQRLDFARKLACALYDRYDLIAHEDLAIRRMVHGNLAKSIYDAAWGTFLHALACKAEGAGKHCIAVDPMGTTQRCSACDAVVPKGRGDRVHTCACGLVMGRDHNAARNIHALGLSAATEARDG